jgi:hypothetical protein
MKNLFDTDEYGDPTFQLMEALNHLPGIVCLASEYETLEVDVLDTYSVTFEVEHTEAGWHSLAFLAWLTSRWLHDESVQLLLTAPSADCDWARGDVAFTLQGNNGHDPLVMASLLNQAMLERFELLNTQLPLQD